MPQNLYDRIVAQLSGFTGVIQWFFLNEPLLDPDRHARIAQLRRAAPKCCIHLTTNWDLMWKKPRKEQLAEIDRLFDSGVNSLNLNDYDGRGYSLIVDLSGYEVVDHCWKRLSKKVISCGPLPIKFHSWGKGVARQAYCARPHRHIVVTFDGRVVVCCAVDPHCCETIGDARDLESAWQSRRMWEYRHELQNKRRVWDCSGCDETMAFPHVVRKVNV